MSFNEFGLIESKNATISASSKTGVWENSRTSLGGRARAAGLYSTTPRIKSQSKSSRTAATKDRNSPASEFYVRVYQRRGIFLSNKPDTNELQRACSKEKCRLTQFMVAGSFRSWLAGLN